MVSEPPPRASSAPAAPKQAGYPQDHDADPASGDRPSAGAPVPANDDPSSGERVKAMNEGSKPEETEEASGDRESIEPDSRAPVIPDELPEAIASERASRAAAEQEAASQRAAASEPEKTLNGTHVMPVAKIPKRGKGRASMESSPDAVRGSRLSMEGRPSRISKLRQTLLSILPPLPISRPAGPFFVIALVVVSLVGGVVWVWKTGRMPRGVMTVFHLEPKAEGQTLPEPTNAEDAPVDETPLPVLHRGRAPMPGGVFYIPSSFIARDDGEYDLIIHFCGNTQLNIESYEAAQVNAVLAILNIGTGGSGAYEDKFANPAAFAEVLQRVNEALKEQGLPNPKLRRIGLVAWSAGYGAVIRILDHPADADRVDAIILLDGIHTSYREGTHIVDGLKIQGVIPFAKRAMAGEKFFLIDHSDIDPVEYLGTHATTDYILEQVGVERHPASGTTPYPHLKAMDGILPTDQLVPLERESEARQGDFIVRGYKGTLAQHHIAHLVQLSTIALPELVERWNK